MNTVSISRAWGPLAAGVLADEEADVGLIAYEMAMLVKSVRPYLVTAPRQHAVEPPAMRP